MDHVVTTRELPSQELITIRRRVTRSEVPSFIRESLTAIYAELEALNGKPIGGPFLVYHAFEPDIDAETCVPISEPIAPAEPMHMRLEPAETVATTLHVGPYEELESAYHDLTAWIAEHGYREVGPVREHYLDGPGEDRDPATYRTEVEMPIEGPEPKDAPAAR
jgi:effector-binding domain-containing protein